MMTTITIAPANDLPISFQEIAGKTLPVKNTKTVKFASGEQNYFVVEVDGKEIEVPERFTK